jgi:hypothetical protein
MFRCRFPIVALVLAGFVASPRWAAADPISITSGFLTVTGAQDFTSR